MMPKAWSNEYRATTVCIDSYENGVLAGRFFNPYLDTGQTFLSLTQFLSRMEQALDGMKFPQSFTATRTFAEPPKQKTDFSGMEYQQGEVATFMVKVLFRQNASWQGSIVWQEGGMEQSFRSALELIFLMDSALSSAKENVS